VHEDRPKYDLLCPAFLFLLKSINHFFDFFASSVGIHFGLFATERIDSHVLIGEYACDIMMQNDLILCKKIDSIMKYTPNSHAYLAPRDFCGFIILMNSGMT